MPSWSAEVLWLRPQPSLASDKNQDPTATPDKDLLPQLQIHWHQDSSHPCLRLLWVLMGVPFPPTCHCIIGPMNLKPPLTVGRHGSHHPLTVSAQHPQNCGSCGLLGTQVIPDCWHVELLPTTPPGQPSSHWLSACRALAGHATSALTISM